LFHIPLGVLFDRMESVSYRACFIIWSTLMASPPFHFFCCHSGRVMPNMMQSYICPSISM
jgi:hypothetical protein